jgi:hypothetical protein
MEKYFKNQNNKSSGSLAMNSQHKSDLKAWLRKYPTQNEQSKHPFEKFERDQSAFDLIKEDVKSVLGAFCLSMFSTVPSTGNLTVAHYMTILQKLTSEINNSLMRFLLNFQIPVILSWR